jgi:hypothetical protein
MECKIKENIENCPCTYAGCDKKGKCCDCLKFHLDNGELPGCCFPKDVEATYDRSFKKFAELVNDDKI